MTGLFYREFQWDFLGQSFFFDEDVEGLSGYLWCVIPKIRCERGIFYKGVKDIIDGAKFSFRFCILRGVGIRKYKCLSIWFTKFMKISIVILIFIITLKAFDLSYKLCFNISMKLKKNGMHLRVIYNLKNPLKIREIIKE